MARLDFCELASASADTADSDQFEKFAKIFMEKILGGIVTKGPSRGADGGIDIRVEFDIAGCRIAKLVSCKHYAPSKNPLVAVMKRTFRTDLLNLNVMSLLDFIPPLHRPDLSKNWSD